MKEQDKELLLKDLCSRLPYNVIVRCYFVDGGGEEILDTADISDMLYDKESELPIYKPYLRPMSSMTDEEANEWAKASNMQYDMEDGFFDAYDAHLSVDWLNSHHFDYRGLIKKNLALEASKEMYNIN